MGWRRSPSPPCPSWLSHLAISFPSIVEQITLTVSTAAFCSALLSQGFSSLLPFCVCHSGLEGLVPFPTKRAKSQDTLGNNFKRNESSYGGVGLRRGMWTIANTPGVETQTCLGRFRDECIKGRWVRSASSESFSPMGSM